MSTKTIIANLNNIKKAIPSMNASIIRECLKQIFEYARLYLLASENNPTGTWGVYLEDESKWEIKVNESCTLGRLTCLDQIATYVEFGIGYAGEVNPHPMANKMDEPYEYDANNHKEKGWTYYDDFYNVYIHTEGYEAHSFLYEAVIKFQDNRDWEWISKKIIDETMRRVIKND